MGWGEQGLMAHPRQQLPQRLQEPGVTCGGQRSSCHARSRAEGGENISLGDRFREQGAGCHGT